MLITVSMNTNACNIAVCDKVCMYICRSVSLSCRSVCVCVCSGNHENFNCNGPEASRVILLLSSL